MGVGRAQGPGAWLLWARNLWHLGLSSRLPVRGGWSRWGEGACEIQIPRLLRPLAIPLLFLSGLIPEVGVIKPCVHLT